MLSLGGYLKKKESLSARLGDVLSYMYLASMVLKHHHDNGAPREDLPVVEWACRSLLYKAQEQLHDFLRNFPNRLLAGFMRLLIFPRGRTYFAPSDRLGAELAELAMSPSPTRARLCRHAYRDQYRRQPAGIAAGSAGVVPAGGTTGEEAARRRREDRTRHRAGHSRSGTPGAATGAAHGGRSPSLLDYDERIMHLINVDDFAPHELAASGS